MPKKGINETPLAEGYSMIGLLAQNVKKLKVVTIAFDETKSLYTIGGKNEQGKSSLIDSIAWLFSGNRELSAIPVRKGAKKAIIEAELKSLEQEFPNLRFKKIIPSSGGVPTLTVSSDDVKAYPSPQAIADDLLGPHRFLDPLAFARMDSKKQLEVTRGLVGLDFTELDKERERLYEERTHVNRDIKTWEEKIKGMEFFTDVPNEPVSIKDLMAELEEKEKENARILSMKVNAEDLHRKIERTDHAIDNALTDISIFKEKIERLQEDIQKHEQIVMDYKASKGKFEEELSKINEEIKANPMQGTASIKDRIESSEDINRKIRSNIAYNQVKSNFEEIRVRQFELNAKIDGIDEEKERLLSEAKFPVEGMSFDEQGVLWQGLPFSKDQISTEEMLRVSMAMGIALNPKLKVFLVRDSIYLDAEHMKVIEDTAKEAGWQVIMEMGGEEGVSLVIEDGMIKDMGESDVG